jgi:hypothetical protein
MQVGERHAPGQGSRVPRVLSKTVTGVLDTPRWGRERSAIMMRFPVFPKGPGRVACALAPVLLVAAACSDSTKPNPVGTGTDVTLAAAQFALYAGSAIPGSFAFPAAPAGAQYLVVAQFATGTPDVHGGYTLTNSLAAPVAALRAATPEPSVAAAPSSVAGRFHDRLRRLESHMAEASRAPAARLAAPPVHRAPATITPPVLNSKKNFKVCGDLNCDVLKTVVSTALYVGSHAAIFVDDSTPAAGFSPSDITSIGQQFDQDLYPIDRAAFGSESDIDSNGVVIILLTPKVNALVAKPDCQTSFVTGFFFGADIDPTFRAQYNNGEIFYGMVPDSLGSVSCAYRTAQVRQLITVTFIHEFQHMISFNQHALVRGGSTEILWLNEALSHLAEELGGRHYDSLGQTATASAFLIGDLYNAGQFLMDPTAVAMVTDSSPGDLAQRGGEWLFLRYLTDRFGATTPRSLVNTTLRGPANVAQATATAFGTLLGRWALAVYTSDLSGFTPPAELRYENWHFRTTFLSLHNQRPADFPRPFPLVPVAASGGAISLAGTLRSGSGSYLLVTQATGAGAFTLTLAPGTGSFPSGASPQLAVVRLR